MQSRTIYYLSVLCSRMGCREVLVPPTETFIPSSLGTRREMQGPFLGGFDHSWIYNAFFLKKHEFC